MGSLHLRLKAARERLRQRKVRDHFNTRKVRHRSVRLALHVPSDNPAAKPVHLYAG
jgi:hypothetical protein